MVMRFPLCHRFIFRLLALAVVCAWPLLPACASDAKPLLHAHSHNDYEHARPLLDALDNGFCNVEADIWLVGDQLLVGHDEEHLKPERTLAALYLKPLQARVQANGGRVFPKGPPITLLIDIKSAAEPTYQALKVTLAPYESILSRFEGNTVKTNAVTIILSGNRPRETLANEKLRFAAYDGRLADLGAGESAAFMPLVSDNWTQHFTWKGEGEFPSDEKDKLAGLVKRAHKEGKRLRFWAAPDNAAGWRVIHSAGVDLVNTDHLEDLRKFFLSEKP